MDSMVDLFIQLKKKEMFGPNMKEISKELQPPELQTDFK